MMPRGRPFPKGVSGNPGGRPKALAEFAELARNKTKPILERLEKIALESDDEQVVIKAAGLIYAYGWGRPAQPLTGPEGAPLFPDAPSSPKEAKERLKARGVV